MFTAVIVSSAVVYAVPFGAMNGGVAPSRPQPHLVGWRDTLAPLAFVKFCTQQSDQCSKRGEGAAVELTGAKRALLQRINFEINNEITHSNEADEDWKVGARVGDCEDFALTKRQRLLDAGWPSGALRIATTRTESGSGHAVLVVTTSKGDLVFDKRTNIVKPWFATGLPVSAG